MRTATKPDELFLNKILGITVTPGKTPVVWSLKLDAVFKEMRKRGYSCSFWGSLDDNFWRGSFTNRQEHRGFIKHMDYNTAIVLAALWALREVDIEYVYAQDGQVMQ